MREIKFRAWYANQEMHYGIAPIDNKYYIFFETQKRNAHDLQINRAISIMQYTGLKDKNGKEIYEGDIVINTGLWYLPSTIKFQHVKERYGEGEIFVVNFNITGVELRHKDNWVMDKEKQFPPNGFIGKPYVDNHDAWNYQESLEIIGNIYENLELLEGKKHD